MNLDISRRGRCNGGVGDMLQSLSKREPLIATRLMRTVVCCGNGNLLDKSRKLYKQEPRNSQLLFSTVVKN